MQLSGYKEWRSKLASVTLHWYKTRPLALAEERHAIGSECPKHNIVGILSPEIVHLRAKVKPKCKCGRPCAYYGKVGGYSVKCLICNSRAAVKRRAAYARRKANA